MSVRSHRWSWVILAIAAAALGGAALASADSSSERVTRFRLLLAKETFEVVRDHPPKGPGKGDILIFRGELLDPKTKKVVGYEGGHCTNVDTVDLRGVCEVIFTPNSTRSVAHSAQITGQAFFDSTQSDDPQLTAITGGSGKYSGARGQILARLGARPDDPAELTFELR